MVCVTWRSGLDIAAGETSATGAQMQLRELGGEDTKVATLRINMLRLGNDRSLESLIVNGRRCKSPVQLM